MFLVAQPCLTLCDPVDCSLPGSSVHGILQARILEWVACPSPGDLPDPGIRPRSPALQADSLPAELPGKPVGASVREFKNLPSTAEAAYVTQFPTSGLRPNSQNEK